MFQLDPLVHYSINKFFLLFIPRLFLDNLPTMLTAFIVTLVPYTPINAIVFCLIFLIIYLTDIFGLASKDVHYCRFNQPKVRTEIELWTALKNTYYWYFIIMMMINYNTAAQYRLFNTNSV